MIKKVHGDHMVMHSSALYFVKIRPRYQTAVNSMKHILMQSCHFWCNFVDFSLKKCQKVFQVAAGRKVEHFRIISRGIICSRMENNTQNNGNMKTEGQSEVVKTASQIKKEKKREEKLKKYEEKKRAQEAQKKMQGEVLAIKIIFDR